MERVEEIQRLEKDPKPGYILFYGKNKNTLNTSDGWFFAGQSIRETTFQKNNADLISQVFLCKHIKAVHFKPDIVDDYYELLRTHRGWDITDPKHQQRDLFRLLSHIYAGNIRSTIVFSISLWEESVRNIMIKLLNDELFLELLQSNPEPFITFIKESLSQGRVERCVDFIKDREQEKLSKALVSRGGLSFFNPRTLRDLWDKTYHCASLERGPLTRDKGFTLEVVELSSEWENTWNDLTRIFKARHIIVHNNGLVTQEDTAFLNDLRRLDKDNAYIEEIIDPDFLYKNIRFMEQSLGSFYEWMFGNWKISKL